MNPFQSLYDYQLFIYTLQDRFPSVIRSTLTVARRGRLLAEVNGEVTAPNLSFLIQEIENLA